MTYWFCKNCIILYLRIPGIISFIPIEILEFRLICGHFSKSFEKNSKTSDDKNDSPCLDKNSTLKLINLNVNDRFWEYSNKYLDFCLFYVLCIMEM